MGRIALAFKAFFGTLFNQATAEKVAFAFRDDMLPKSDMLPAPTVATKPERTPAKPIRSDALTLLEALQREARFIDLCQESLDAYSDEQVGAAARNVLRDTSKVLDRFFALQPLASEGEGAEVSVPAGYEPLQFRLLGAVSGSPPYRGRIVHAGWKASRCELPQWTGGKESSLIVAATEVEVA